VKNLRLISGSPGYFSRKAIALVENESDRLFSSSALPRPESSLPGIDFSAVSDEVLPAIGTQKTDPSGPLVSTRARIAVYDDLLSSPRIIDIEPAPLLLFIERIAQETYERAQSLGGRMPYSVIRELAENFIHAAFKECTVSVLDRGNTIRFSDQGPGIDKKLLVLQPGITSANDAMRFYIKGVGSGFPIVKEYLSINHGSLRIDDNAIEGAVVTLSLLPVSEDMTSLQYPAQSTALPALLSDRLTPVPEEIATPAYSTHQLSSATQDPRTVSALRIISELGAAGPTDLTGPLNISAATAHRLLLSLETAGLLEKTSNRKRILSNAGLGHLNRLEGH
jgi:hypothetical protein